MLQKPNGPKTRLPKVVKSSSVQQEDIEIEIAEVLFGLTKQSHNSKKADGDDNIQKLESKDAKAISEDTKSSVSVMPQSTNPASDLLPDGTNKEFNRDIVNVLSFILHFLMTHVPVY